MTNKPLPPITGTMSAIEGGPATRPARQRREAPIERGGLEEAVAILGLPERTVQSMAARGEIPGAAKLGRRWTFDIARLRTLVRNKERQTWVNAKHRPDAIGARAPSGAALRSTAATSDGRFTRLTRRLRARAGKPGKSA
jgi:hypothetical protein